MFGGCFGDLFLTNGGFVFENGVFLADSPIAEGGKNGLTFVGESDPVWDSRIEIQRA